MIVALPPRAVPGTILTAMSDTALAFAEEPSLLNLMQGIVAVFVPPDMIMEKLAEEFPDVKLVVAIVPPGACENVFTVEFSVL